ncbi:hypothetical protein SEA_FIZZLES_11 [Microbacterium phage Fizzles]|nr:hypothetical protein SEA_FIZZLES_11 [Microbacterium phage Fizzles]
MTDKSQAIQVSVDLEIDWAELGRVFAEETSARQAEFILGFYEAVADAQLIYIGQERIFDGERDDVASVMQLLATYIETAGA